MGFGGSSTPPVMMTKTSKEEKRSSSVPKASNLFFGLASLGMGDKVDASSKAASTASGSGRSSPQLGDAVAPPRGSNDSAQKRSPKLGASGSGSGNGSDASGLSPLRKPVHIGSVADDWPMYSSQKQDYILSDIVGFGATSIVYQAAFLPLGGRACAVKVIDLEAFGGDTDVLRRETQLMSLSKHPNVLRVRGCWLEGSKLHIATRLMNSGSMLDIMRFSYPDGFDEPVIATVLKQALEGLNYLHQNGWLHRDLKAANMLVDEDGTVLLGDFGVGVFLNERPTGNKSKESIAGGAAQFSEGTTKSFVGTPCWMAPEVVERKHYGHKADIWSFGITALELAQGRAPLSRLAPVKVLMKTLQDEPPQLDRTGGAHKYSKVMEDFVRVCLQKDPSKRPSAEKLLGHAFFKQAKSKKFLETTVLAGLPPLAERQERRRNQSIISMRNQQSWDFGSGSGSTIHHSPGGVPSAHSGSGLPFSADPFKGFSGSVAPVSPGGSMRSIRHMSIDGERSNLSSAANEAGFEPLAQRFRGGHDTGSGAPSPVGSRFMTGNSSRRTRSIDSFGRANRKSVSFDEPASASGAFAAAPTLSPSSSVILGPPPAGSLRLRNRGLTGDEIYLSAIGEKRSPLVQPTDATAESNSDERQEAIPPLALSPLNQSSSQSDTSASTMQLPHAETTAKEPSIAQIEETEVAADPVSANPVALDDRMPAQTVQDIQPSSQSPAHKAEPTPQPSSDSPAPAPSRMSKLMRPGSKAGRGEEENDRKGGGVLGKFFKPKRAAVG